MARIRSRNTLPELTLRRALWSRGARGLRTHLRVVANASSPDIAYTRWRVAVYVDGCFWHGHPSYFTPGKSGTYWDTKIAKNKLRDRRTNQALRRNGWNVIRVWDFEVEDDPAGVANRVCDALASMGWSTRD